MALIRPSRRQLLALGAAGLALPRAARPAPAAGERKFLFVFCPGGWDVSCGLAPMFDNANVDTEPDAVYAEAGGIPFVDHALRPSVRAFFESYGRRSCVVHGMEVRSVAHDTCLRISMTGTSLPGADDFPTLLAANSLSAPLLPLLHLSGPNYTHDYGSAVVRVGSAGQLADLVDGGALALRDVPLSAPAAEVQALEDAYALARAQAFAARAGRGRAATVAQLAADAESRMAQLTEVASQLQLGQVGRDLSTDLVTLVDALGSGLARVGMVAFDGYLGLGWDTHGVNFAVQGPNHEELFGALLAAAEALEAAPGEVAPSLLDEVTVVVLSEMARYPQLNPRDGKEHWTFTSFLLFGAGVAGGRVIGGYDDQVAGEAVDLASGDIHASGEALVPGHLGATLLALADIDPAEHFSEAPIAAVLEG